MKRQLRSLFTVMFVLFSVFVYAQTRTINGIVTDENGDPAVAATVRVTGTEIGTVTDLDGNFSLEVPQTAETITISYIGMEAQTVAIEDNMSISLTTDENVLEDVVVTALGQAKKERNLSYSVDNLTSDQVTKTSATNVTQALAGKVSGMQINTSNNGVNPGTRVQLRGRRSILGGNQALIVVDGYPTSSSALDQISPNDIESISVLKGANASALYGSDASNGVVMITTKSGQKEGLNVTYQGNFDIESVAYLPEWQDEFGSGGFPDGTLLPLENVYWGPRFDPSIMVPVSETLNNGEVWEVPFAPIEDNYLDFFEQAPTFRNGITLSSGGADGSFLMSVDHTDTEGILPKDAYNRTNIRLKADKKIDRFTASGNFSLFRSATDVVGNGGRQDRSVYWNIFNTPLHLPIGEVKNWRDGKFTRNETSFYAFYENPYFIIDTQREESKANNFSAIGDLSYEIIDGLSANARVGYTNSGSDFKRRFGALDYVESAIPDVVYNRTAEYGARTASIVRTGMRLNTDAFLKYTKDITTDWSVDALAGHNYRTVTDKFTRVDGNELIVPGFWNVSSRTGQLGTNSGEEYSEYRKLGAYGSVDVGFRDFLYINLTARNDWSSTLDPSKNSYFYPGGGVALILSDAIPGLQGNETLNFLKASFNMAKTGGDPGAYAINNAFIAGFGFPFANTTGLTQSGRAPDQLLNPEFTESIEAGLEFGFIEDRIHGNFTLFQSNTIDQIIPIQTSLASGASSNLVNLGEVESKGVEVDLNLAVIENTTNGLYWDVSANYFTNKSEVLSLTEGVEEVDIGGVSWAQVIAKVGEPFPLMRTDGYERDPQGRIIVDADGDPIISSEFAVRGQTEPKYQVGLNTTLEYKNWSLYAAGDYRTGHVFYSRMADGFDFNGLNEVSVTSGRGPFVFPNSSYNVGTADNPEYVANTDRVTSGAGFSFFNGPYNVGENFVYDATALKIRELSLNYSLPQSFLEPLNIANASIGAYGFNVFTRLPESNMYTDPEFNFTTGNAQGYNNDSQLPPTRNFGMNLNVNF